jgi:hypothetical protein
VLASLSLETRCGQRVARECGLLHRPGDPAAMARAPGFELDQLSPSRRGQDCPSPGIAGACRLFRISRSRAAQQALRGGWETSPTACWRPICAASS